MEGNKDQILACLNLVRRLPPTKINQNTNALIHLVPDLEDDLLQRIDQPLEIETDAKAGRDFIKSEYNRDGDSHRSPWSNEYFPALEEGNLPSERARSLEIKANFLFDEYRKMYYEGGVASVYVWDKSGKDYALGFLCKKDVDQKKGVEKGCWDSINIVDVKIQNNKVSYRLTTSLILDMKINNPENGEVVINGTLAKKKELIQLDYVSDDSDLERIGKLIEDMETNMRRTLDTIYLGKTKEIVFTLRSMDGKELEKRQKEIRDELFKNKE